MEWKENFPTNLEDIADRRFEIIKLYDFFNEWAEEQADIYGLNGGMFVIAGP